VTTALMIVLRILHIGAGVSWAGSVFLFVVLIQPTAAAIGPAATPFMMELLGRRKLVRWLLGLGAATILGGVLLYLQDASEKGGLGNFVTSWFGFVLLVGAVSAVTAWLIGFFGTRPNANRLLALAAEASSDGPRNPALGQEIALVQARLKTLARVSFVLIAITVLAMASARELTGS
jgi:hypothetical protein